MRVLNRDAIKYIAMLTMLLNHIAHIFLQPGSALALVFEYIGYFTAPTMCYFLVEGYDHTRSKVKYGRRLLFFAVVSQVPFSLAFDFGGLNMIYTLFCCFLILVVMEKVHNPFGRMVLCTGLLLLTVIGDWPLMAPVFTILFRNAGDDRRKIVRAYVFGYAFFVFLMIQTYLMNPDYTNVEAALYGLVSGAAIIISALTVLFFYNGRRAERGGNFSKWFFYLFYPGHIAVLYVIKRIAIG